MTKIRSKYGLIFVAIVLFLGVLSSRALAGTNVSKSPALDSTCPRIATDSNGNIHAAWVEMYTAEGGDVFYSKSTDNGATWSTPFNVSNSGTVYVLGDRMCDLDIDGSGRVYVIWAESEILKLRISSGGSWGAISTLYTASSSKCNCPKVGVTPGGDIYTVWWTGNGVVRSRARVGPNWEDVKSLSRGGTYSKFPDIAVGDSVVYVVYVEKGSVEGYAACYTKRNLAFNSAWTARQTLPFHTGSHQHAVVAIDSSDVAHVVWTPELGGTRVLTYTHSTASGFTAAQDISKQQLLHYPSIAARAQRVCAIWQVGGYDAGTNVSYCIRQNGTWSAQAAIPQSNGGSFCDVAASPDGSVFYFLWDSKGEIYFALNSSSPPPPPPTGDLNPPTLTSPANGATGLPLSVTLQWQDTNSSPQEVRYRIRFKQAGGAYVYFNTAQNATSYIKAGLAKTKTYSWNVMAKGNGTTTKDSAWANSGVDWSFTTSATPAALNPPTLTSPANGATGRPLRVTLQWQDTNSSPQEVRYRIRFKQAGGAYVYFNTAQNATSYVKAGLARNKTYSWNVRAKGNGTTIKDSAWANSGVDRKFTTIK